MRSNWTRRDLLPSGAAARGLVSQSLQSACRAAPRQGQDHGHQGDGAQEYRRQLPDPHRYRRGPHRLRRSGLHRPHGARPHRDHEAAADRQGPAHDRSPLPSDDHADAHLHGAHPHHQRHRHGALGPGRQDSRPARSARCWAARSATPSRCTRTASASTCSTRPPAAIGRSASNKCPKASPRSRTASTRCWECPRRDSPIRSTASNCAK